MVCLVRCWTGGFELGEVTVIGALSDCAHLGDLSQGVWIHEYIRRAGSTCLSALLRLTCT